MKRPAIHLMCFSATTLWLAGVAFAGAPSADDLAMREAMRQHDLDAGLVSPARIVSGAPSTKATVDLSAFAKEAQGFEPGPSRAGDAGDSGLRRSLWTVSGEQGMAFDLGGDDVNFAATGDPADQVYLAVTNSGDYFIVVNRTTSIQVYKSTDSGDTWDLWSVFVDPGVSFFLADVLLADGTPPRLFVAYAATDVSPQEARVAYVDPTVVSSPTWTIVTALADVGVDHASNGRVSLASDVDEFSNYFVYVVAQGDDGNGDDIWFTRSTNQGASYAAGYRIADTSTGADHYDDPLVEYGAGNYVHAVYEATINTPYSETSKHRRVPSWAGGGAPAWEAEQDITPTNGVGRSPLAFTASLGGDNSVIVTYLVTGPIEYYIRYSTDAGVTWPGANEVQLPMPGLSGVAPLIQPSGDVVIVGKTTEVLGGQTSVFLTRSNLADLTLWSAPETMSTHNNDSASLSARLDGGVLDPARGHRVAIAWIYPKGTSGFLRFDAEHRRDPGYANTEVGLWTIGIGGGLQTPPAIAEVDGDAELEIIFGTTTGDIHVRDHDGYTVPGWPVNIGSMPLDAPVAVGHLSGEVAVVAGNNSGQVYAFDKDGNVMPGWPYQMSSPAATFVSMGPLAPTLPNYVVAVCQDQMVALRYDGQDVSPNWGTFTANFSRPVAIGDVDNDGEGEIVSLKGSWLHVHSLSSGSSEAFRNFPTVFGVAPTLADLDLDGDLEIVAPNTAGSIYVLNHDGTDYSANWPQTVASGSALTEAALANFIGTGEVEIVVAEKSGTGLVHLFFLNGTEQSSYPRTTEATNLYMPPIIDSASPTSAADILMAVGTTGYGNGNNIGQYTPGWPRNMHGTIEETFAAGDIDLDGRKELVVLGTGVAQVYDLGETTVRSGNRHWPMYAYDARRTGCLDCDDIVVGIEDLPTAQREELGVDVYPNPFNPSTTIAYEVAVAGPVTVKVYDVSGRLVDTLVDGVNKTPDRYELTYQPALSSGVYFVKVESAGEVRTRKIHLLK